MRSTLRNMFLASAVAAMAALGTGSALADTMVNVPFSFTVNGKTCPAGLYTVGRNNTNGLVTLRNDDWQRSFTWVAAPGDPAPTDTRIVLQFDRAGDGYTLRSVQYRNLVTSRLDGRTKQNEAPARVVLGR
jgi:hypothetical protein